MKADRIYFDRHHNAKNEYKKSAENFSSLPIHPGKGLFLDQNGVVVQVAPSAGTKIRKADAIAAGKEAHGFVFKSISV
jgi:hypothetical protein